MTVYERIYLESNLLGLILSIYERNLRLPANWEHVSR